MSIVVIFVRRFHNDTHQLAVMDDSVRFKEELERLKIKYRKEALRAVATADAEGYERGKLEVKDAAEKKIAQWKAVAEAVTSNDSGHSKPVSLVQHIMQKIYNEFKLECASETEIPMSKLKAILLLSTGKLMDSLPEIVLASSVTTNKQGANPTDTAPQDLSPTCSCASCSVHGASIASLSTAGAKVPSANSSALKEANDRRLLRVVHRASPPPFFVGISIQNTTGHIVKGVFIDSQFISYDIDVCLGKFNYASLRANLNGHNNAEYLVKYTTSKRNNDLLAFHQQLVKECPKGMIPAVPSKNYKIVATVKNGTYKKGEKKMLYRKRSFALWLQYIGNMAHLQCSPAFIQFLSAQQVFFPQSSAVASANPLLPPPSTRESEKLAKGCVSEIFLHASSFAAQPPGLEGVDEAAVKHAVQSFMNISQGPRAAGEDATAARPVDAYRHAYKQGNAHLQPEQVAGDDTDTSDALDHRGHLQVFSVQRVAHRELLTVERDISQLEQSAKAAVASCKNLVDSWCDLGVELRAICDEFSVWGVLEPPQSLEHASIDVITAAAGESNLVVDSIGETLQCSLFESVEFLQESCVQAARESVDSILKSHPLSSFVPERPYYQAPADNSAPGNGTGTGSGGLRGDTGDMQTLVRVREGIALAVGAAQNWDSSKRVRGAMMLQHMLATAKTMAKEHGRNKKIWQRASKALKGINVTTGGDTSAALEESSSRLKAAIQDEMHGLGGRASESYESGRKTEDYSPSAEHSSASQSPPPGYTPAPKASSGSGMSALKSFRAIFSRAKVPKGARRSPSVCKPSLPVTLEEDSMVAQFHAQQEATNSSNSAPATAAAVPESSSSSAARSTKNNTSAARTAPSPSPNNSAHDLQAVQAASASYLNQTHIAATEPDLLQQDQRQHRIAARRHMAGQAPAHTSKIKTSQTPLVAQASIPEGFGAAPQPATAVQSHAVFTNATGQSTSLPLPGAVPPMAEGSSGKPNKPAARSVPENVPDVSSEPGTPQFQSTSRKTAVPSAAAPVNVTRTTTAASTSSNSSPPIEQRESPQAGTTAGAGEMPSGWIEVATEDGGVYYYHSITRVSRWDRPNEEVAAALEARILQANSQVDEAVQKRKEELRREKEQQEERDVQVSQLQTKVKQAVETWKHPPGVRGGRDVMQLLANMHTVLSYIPADAVVDPAAAAAEGGAAAAQPVSLAFCKPIDVKKAYMRAVRFVHPDKLPDNLGVETEMLAELVFITINDAFNSYRTKLEASS